MFKNYFKIAVRNLLRHKGYSLINIAGLALGITCCLLILLYVRHELSYDHYHHDADQIHRAVLHTPHGENEINLVLAPAPLGATLVKDFPAVLQAARIFPFNRKAMVRAGDKSFHEKRFYFADSTVFAVLTIPLRQGDPKTALADPNSVVITETTARKYFGQANPLGQMLKVNDRAEYRITGVAADPPANTHFHFDFLASLITLRMSQRVFWTGNINFHTYVLLQKDYPKARLEAQFPAFIRKYVGEELNRAGMALDEAHAYSLSLQPLTGIHLHSHLEFELEPNGDIAYVYGFSAIAGFILLIACINFMNLSTARAANRAREVGVRKALGSGRPQLVRQFLLEAILSSLVAFLAASALVELLLPFFNQLAGQQMATNYFSDPKSVVGAIGLALLVGIIAGSYPAFYLTSFQPAAALQGKLVAGSARVRLRSGLVVLQFVISVVLIVGTMVVAKQVNYIRAKNLGFDKENVVVLPAPRHALAQIPAFKQELQHYANVIGVSASNTMPGGEFGKNAFRRVNAPPDEMSMLQEIYADADYVATLGMKLAAGRAFQDWATDSSAVLLNEAAVKMSGWRDPVGSQLNSGDGTQTFTVIGVLQNFHFETLRNEIQPLMMHLSSSFPQFVSVRIRPDDTPATLAFLKKQWEAFFPRAPFEYSFLDQDFDALHRADQRLGKIFSVFSSLAILIACIGLFSLSAFTAEQRTKEIGIRKVLGASVSGIIGLLSKDFVKLVLIANLLAWPVAWFAMNKWLQTFAYRIEIAWWIFLLAGGLALVIALLTVGTQAIKAALVNPVEALRYE